VVLRGGDRLAGSSLRMDRGIGHLVHLAERSLADAVQMATLNPARAMGLEGRMEGLVSGERADLVRFRYPAGARHIEVLETWLDGECVFRAE
jgi:N-acetylglucosamine-6-phosphate deacetylase